MFFSLLNAAQENPSSVTYAAQEVTSFRELILDAPLYQIHHWRSYLNYHQRLFNNLSPQARYGLGLAALVECATLWYVTTKCNLKKTNKIGFPLAIILNGYRVTKKLSNDKIHSQMVLAVFNCFADQSSEKWVDGFIVSPYCDVTQISDSVKILGVSTFTTPLCSFDADMHKYKACVDRGMIVVLGMGNNGLNFENPYQEKFLDWAKDNHNVVLVGSIDSRANFLTREQVERLSVNYVKAPYTFSHQNQKCLKVYYSDQEGEFSLIEGTSFGQPYVSALLYKTMKNFPGHTPGNYVKALMSAQNKLGDVYDFEGVVEEMLGGFKSKSLI